MKTILFLLIFLALPFSVEAGEDTTRIIFDSPPDEELVFVAANGNWSYIVTICDTVYTEDGYVERHLMPGYFFNGDGDIDFREASDYWLRKYKRKITCRDTVIVREAKDADG